MSDERAAGAFGPRNERERRLRAAAIGALTGALVLSLAVGAVAFAVVGHHLGCHGRPDYLHVAASTDIAPALQEIANQFNAAPPDVGGGHCAEVFVTENSADEVAAWLTGVGTFPGLVNAGAWVPDTSLWLELVRGSIPGSRIAQPTGISVAHSPVVLATTGSASKKIVTLAADRSWRLLFPPGAGGPAAGSGLFAGIPDPLHTGSGITALIAAQKVIGDSESTRSQLTDFMRNVRQTAPLDANNLGVLSAYAGPPFFALPVGVTSEQAVWEYNRHGPKDPVVAVYPREGTLDLDYPFVITSSDPAQVRAAQAFEGMLRSAYTQSVVRGFGFRAPDEQPDPQLTPFGIDPAAPKTLAAPAAGDVGAAIQTWNRISLPSRTLVLADVSDTTSTVVPGSTLTELQVAKTAASLGLSLFPDNTDMGLWLFADHLNGATPYREEVAIGPLPESVGLLSRRQALQQYASTISTESGSKAALYASILAAYKNAVANYVPNKNDTLIVLTAGVDNASNSIPLSSLVGQLKQTFSPQHPVYIIIVAFGSDSELPALNQIAGATDGKAYLIHNAGEIGTVFYDALSRRFCEPDCHN